MDTDGQDDELPRRYTSESAWARLTVGRADDAVDRIRRGYGTATARVPEWLGGGDLDEAELTRRAKDRLVERSREARDRHIETERLRRVEYGASYRMLPPPPVEVKPQPTSREISRERTRAKVTRWVMVLGGAVIAPQVLFAPGMVRLLPVVLLVGVVAVVGYLWSVGGPAPAVEAEACAEAPDEARASDAAGPDDATVEASPATTAPSVDLLKQGRPTRDDGTDATRTTATLDALLAEHGVDATVSGHVRGPAITRYLLTLGAGVRISRVSALAGDIGRAMGCEHEPWIGPVPGDTRLAVELPNAVRDEVMLGEVLRGVDLSGAGPLTVGLGRDVDGTPLVADLATLPHLLVGGATGAGKSVCLNALICSPLVRGVPPEQLRMILVDPKRVELAAYQGIPHLLRPIVTDAQRAVDALGWVAAEGGEMDRRYALLEANGVRNITAFNSRAEAGRAVDLAGRPCGPLPYLLVVIDELADLIIVSKEDVETHVVRTTQLARAAGIHLVVATQRPSTDVVTGLIKANLPSRLAFATASGTDSRVVLDEMGAQCLLGKGDALFKPIGAKSARRMQAAMISDGEIDAVVAAWQAVQPDASAQPQPDADASAGAQPDAQSTTSPDADAGGDADALPDLDLLLEAAKLIINTQFGSTSMLRRKLRIRHARAAELMDALEDAEIVGPASGHAARQVLIAPDELPVALARLTSKDVT